MATANTRELLAYSVSTTPYMWYEVTNPTYIVNDDEVRGIFFGGRVVRFYGGRKSGEYGGVMVSSNGFISFDSEISSKYNLNGIPHANEPNTFAAPFWRDLDPAPASGGSITWGYVTNVGIVISWSNVRNKINGASQTFQVVLEEASGVDNYYGNSRIWFNYQSVTKDDQTTIGVEDQRGLRGVSYNYQNINNGISLKFEQTSNSAFIQFLTIKLNKSRDYYASLDIIEDPDEGWIRGHNVRLSGDEEDPSQGFLVSLTGEAALLLISTGVGAKAGFLLGAMSIGFDVVARLASAQKPANLLEIRDQIDESYARAPADGRPDYLTVVDASVGINVFWKFTDNNDQDHSLTVIAELEYAEVDAAGQVVAYRTITTSVPLRFLRDLEPKQVVFPTYIIGTLLYFDFDTEDQFWYVLPGWYSYYHVIQLVPQADADLELYLYNYCTETGDMDLLVHKDDGGLGQAELIREGPLLGSPDVPFRTNRLIRIVYKSGPGQSLYHLQTWSESYGEGSGGGGGPIHDITN